MKENSLSSHFVSLFTVMELCKAASRTNLPAEAIRLPSLETRQTGAS